MEVITDTSYQHKGQESTIESSGYDSLSASDSDDSSPECDVDNALLDEEQLSPTSDLEYAMLDIDHVLKCLYRFSTVLYQAVPANRIRKCASIDVKRYEFLGTQHVANKFPHAPEALLKRLGRANTKRRQLLIYNERHHKKIISATLTQLQGLLELAEEIQEDKLEGTEPNTVPGLDPDPENWEPIEPIQAPGTVLSVTTATTFRANNKTSAELEPLPEEIGQGSDTGTRYSETSYASSYADGLGGYRLSVPDPPQHVGGRFDDEPFLCPYCHDMVCIKNSKSWK